MSAPKGSSGATPRPWDEVRSITMEIAGDLLGFDPEGADVHKSRIRRLLSIAEAQGKAYAALVDAARAGLERLDVIVHARGGVIGDDYRAMEALRSALAAVEKGGGS